MLRLKKFKSYLLLLTFIGRRATFFIYQSTINFFQKLPMRLRLLKLKIGAIFRKKKLAEKSSGNSNFVDRADFESLKQKAEAREKELQDALALTRATLESTADAILMTRKEGGLLDWNQKLVDMAGIPDEIVKNKDERAGLTHVLNQMADPDGLLELMKKLDKNPQIKGAMGEVQFKDGRIIERYTQPHVVGGKIVGRVWSFRDITARKKAEESLRLQERALQASAHGVIITDSAPDYKIIYVNPAFEKITGYSAKEVMGRNCQFLQGDDREQPELNKIRRALKEHTEGEAILRNYRKDGTLFWNELHVAPVPDPNGKVTHYVGILIDVTQRKAMEDQLLHQATHDMLTNLPNRVLLNDRIQQSMLASRRSNTLTAVLFLDLDRFKIVNDSLGHEIGDQLIKKIGERLHQITRETDTLARMGGDEFIIVIPYLPNYESLVPIANNILTTISKPVVIQRHHLNITGSIGISFYPDDGSDVTTLIKNADLAMYRAKDMGRNNFQFYTSELSQKITRRLALESDLHHAVQQKDFVLYYQPLVDLKTGAIMGAEALLRWVHPKMGIIPPLEFISVAEETGLIIPLGEWIFKTACQECKTWHSLGHPVSVAINLSGKQFNHSNLSNYIESVLKETKLNPEYLEIEITESLLLENTPKVTKILADFKKMQIKLAIDDFGTGYSSLSYLKKLTVDTLKIDISFIRGLPDDDNDRAITLAIIAMTKQLRLTTIAEGVENERQVEFLRKHDCNYGQGYYFGRPMPALEFKEFLDKNPRIGKD